MNEPWRIIGEPRRGGFLVVADHASNRVPDDIDLGISADLLDQHIASDLGVAAVAQRMAGCEGFAAFLGNVSRLVCDFNRDEHGPTVCPIASDGHAIPGNALNHEGHEERLRQFFRPYHGALASVLAAHPPILICSVHSFTPQLSAHPEQERPWDCGVLYNQDDRASRLAIAMLEEQGVIVGDQEPYSGKLLNATMNRHAEAEGRTYFGIEIRQDRIADAAQQELWAERLVRICNRVALALD